MQKPSKLAQIPQIRFAGFTKPWEIRKLGDCAKFSKGSGYSKNDLCNIGTPIILYGRLYTKYETIIKKVNTFVRPKDSSVYSKGGEIIIPASGETANDIARASAVENSGILLGGDLNIISPDKAINSAFLALSISNGKPQKELAKKAQGKSVVHISNSEIKELNIPFPQKAEQQKIGELFANLDNLITLHHRKVEKLQKIKKSCLQNLFPQNNQNTPKIRFKNFSDEWEVRKLGEITNYRRGSFPQPYGKSEWYDGEEAKPFIQVADITDSMNLVSDTKQKISKLAQPMSVFAEKGSVLVTLQGSIGRVAITQYGAFVDRTVLIFEKYKIDIDNLFWAYIIKQKFIKEARKAPGGTIKTITKEALSDFDLLLSNYNEQEKIGAFFFKLDKLITLQQRKVEKLKKIKAAMLSKAFI